MNRFAQSVGKWIATYLSKQIQIENTAPPINPLHLQANLLPGDVLLVEGNTRLSTAIKYLTQSTWSHAALYVGTDASHNLPHGHCFVEADAVHGVRSVGLDEFANLHTRICRPIGLNQAEQAALVRLALSKIGDQYDLRNVFDLARYLLPTPPVPTKMRRQMLSLGSGDPTRAICSTLIAHAFQSIRYPILPILVDTPDGTPLEPRPIAFKQRHASLFTPRDFDVSPYFDIIKPTAKSGFNFRNIEWVDPVSIAK